MIQTTRTSEELPVVKSAAHEKHIPSWVDDVNLSRFLITCHGVIEMQSRVL